MDYSFQANGSFAVSSLYNGRGDFSTPCRNVSEKYFYCSWLCRFVFCKSQYLIVYGFMARLAEMDGHKVVGRADTFCETGLFAWYLLLLSGGGCLCLHGIGSFLRGGGFDIVVVGYHLLWFLCSSKAGTLDNIVFPAFIPVTFLRPALFDIRHVFSVAAPRVTPRRVPCKGCSYLVSDWLRYSIFCGVCFSRPVMIIAQILD